MSRASPNAGGGGMRGTPLPAPSNPPTSRGCIMSRADDGPKKMSVVGLIGFALGGVGLAFSIAIPCLSFLALPISIAGLVLALVGVGLAASNKRTSMILPVLALLVSGAATAFPFVFANWFLSEVQKELVKQLKTLEEA